MKITDELKLAWKIIAGFALNVAVGFILFALIAISIKYAVAFYFLLFGEAGNEMVSILNTASTIITVFFFLAYQAISIIKFCIEMYYELKKLITKHKNEQTKKIK